MMMMMTAGTTTAPLLPPASFGWPQQHVFVATALSVTASTIFNE